MREWRGDSIRQLVGAPVSGKRPTGGVNAETEGIPSLGGENIRAEGGMDYETVNKIPSEFFRSMPKGRLQANDVLINKDGAQTGKVGIYDGRFAEAAVNEHVFILRSNSGAINQRLLYYYLLLPETQLCIARRITGSAQPGLNSQFVDAVHLTVPSDRCEQRRIAEILSTVDEAIEQTKALIAKTQRIKAGLMRDLFTRGVTADGQLRPPREEVPQLYKESALGWIPKEWTLERLEQGATRITDGCHQSVRRETGLSAEVPFAFVSCVRAGRLLWHRCAAISKTTYLQVSRGREPHAGMALFTVVGSIGNVAVLTDDRPVAFERNVACISPSAKVNSNYLANWLSTSIVQRHAERVAVGNAQRLISLAKLRQFPLLLPEAHEQGHIATRLQGLEESDQSEIEWLAKLNRLKVGLMQDLLTGRVPVAAETSSKVAEVAANV